MSRFEEAKEKYASIGVDVDKALDTLSKVRISMHCWQGDDVLGLIQTLLQVVLLLLVIILVKLQIQMNLWQILAKHIL